MDSISGLLAPANDDSGDTILADNLNPVKTGILASDTFDFTIRLPGVPNSRKMHFFNSNRTTNP